MPRSVSTGRPSAVKTMLPGDRSPCTIRRSCAWARAAATGRDRRDHLSGPQPAPPGEQRGQAAAGQQVQHQRHPAPVPRRGWCDHLMQPHQVRVVELAEQRRLPFLPLGVASTSTLTATGGPPCRGPRPPDLPGPATAERLSST